MSQVLSHLGSGAEIALAVLDGALEGTGPKGAVFNRSVWARWDAMSPQERAVRFLFANEALVTRYEKIDTQTRMDLRVNLGFLPAPVDLATVAGLRLSEFTFHTWDIEVTFDPAAVLSPAATGLLLDQAGLLVGRLGRADAVRARPIHIAVRTTAPDRSFGLHLGETVTLDTEPADPDAVLSAPAEWWLRLTTGRHAPPYTPAGVTLTGKAIGLDDLRQVFPGF